MYCTSIIWPKIIIDGWPFGTILSLQFFPSFSCGGLFTTFSFGEKKRHRIKMPMVGGNWGYVFFVAEKIEIPMLLISNDVVMTAWQGFAFWRYHGDSKIPRHPTMISFYTSKDLKKSPLTSTPHRPSHWIKMRKKNYFEKIWSYCGPNRSNWPQWSISPVSLIHRHLLLLLPVANMSCCFSGSWVPWRVFCKMDHFPYFPSENYQNIQTTTA